MYLRQRKYQVTETEMKDTKGFSLVPKMFFLLADFTIFFITDEALSNTFIFGLTAK